MTTRILEIPPQQAPLRVPQDPLSNSEEFYMEAKVQSRHFMNEEQMDGTVEATARAIINDIHDSEDVVLIGIRTRGVPMAKWLADKISLIRKKNIACGSLDINLYRDDLSEVWEHPIIKQTELPFPIANKGVILVDDVLYTGRTIRAAMDALLDFGRPKYIRLAAMVDRVGFRELPIQADYVGAKIETVLTENVKVRFKECDGTNEIVILNKTN